MKITVRQLKTLIREAVEECYKEEDVMEAAKEEEEEEVKKESVAEELQEAVAAAFRAGLRRGRASAKR